MHSNSYVFDGLRFSNCYVFNVAPAAQRSERSCPDAGFRSFRDVKLREGQRAFFVGLPSVLHRFCDSDL